MNASPGKLTMIGSGLLVFIFSFLPWFGSGDYTISAWGEGLFPVATWAPIFALVVVVLVALPAFTEVKLPEKVLDFTIDQLTLVATVFVLLITLGYLIVSSGGSKGFGLYVCFIGALGLIGGYVMDKQGIGASPSTEQGYVAPGGFPPAGQQPQAPAPGYAPQQPGQAPAPGQPQAPAPGYAPQQPPQQPGQQPPPQPPQQPGQGSF